LTFDTEPFYAALFSGADPAIATLRGMISVRFGSQVS